MRILIALTYYRPHYSGLTIHAEREALALARRGHQVTILTSRFDPDLPAHEIKTSALYQHGIEIVRPKVWFHVSKGVIMPGMPLAAWRLIRQADVVHLHAPQFDAAPLALLSRLLGKPVVLTYHCDLLLPSGLIHAIANRVSNVVNHITARLAQIIVHNTLDYAENSPFLKRYLEKVYPILPPVELATITPEQLMQERAALRAKYNLQPGQRLIGMAARLATEKGVEYLAQALPQVLKKYPTARVLFVGPYKNVVGEEDYAQRLAPLIQALGEHWTFLGVITPTELVAFFHECEVTVLPSINSTESYGLVQVESIMSGTPVISTDLPGVRVPVKMSGSGMIVAPGNAQALAVALLELLENPSAFQGQAQSLIEKSAPDCVAVEYEKAFFLAGARETPQVAKEQISQPAEKDPLVQFVIADEAKQFMDAGSIGEQGQRNNPSRDSNLAPVAVQDELPLAHQAPGPGTSRLTGPVIQADMPTTAIILAGGLGTRLRGAIGELPKALAPVAGRPFLDYLLTYLVSEGIQHVILALGYQAHLVRDFAGDGRSWGLRIEYTQEEVPLGTGGALRNALQCMSFHFRTDAPSLAGEAISEMPFFVMNGDTLFQVSLRQLWAFHQQVHAMQTPRQEEPVVITGTVQRAAATIALREITPSAFVTQEAHQRGMVSLNEAGRIVNFNEKTAPAEIRMGSPLLTNGGIYIMNQAALEGTPQGQVVSLEREIFPRLVQAGCLAGQVQHGYFVDIGTPESLACFEMDVLQGNYQWMKASTS